MPPTTLNSEEPSMFQHMTQGYMAEVLTMTMVVLVCAPIDLSIRMGMPIRRLTSLLAAARRHRSKSPSGTCRPIWMAPMIVPSRTRRI